jgi:oxaloacetate decarboxylase gamma subunit
MELNLIQEGIKFMLLGMGSVFIFLTVLIIVMNIMSKIIQTFFPEHIHSPHLALKKEEINKSKLYKNRKIAAITAAIEYHKQKGL